MEGKLNITLRMIAGVAGIMALWFNVAVCAIGVVMLAWVHRALGRSFAASLHIRTVDEVMTFT